MKIALQLFSLYNIMKQEDGLCKALKYAADAGYDGVELSGLFDLSPEEVKAELDKNGLEAAGYHIGWPPIKLEDLENDPEGVIQIAKTLGLQSMTVASYNGKTRQEWVDFATRVNKIGKVFRVNGIPLCYHNHRHELKPLPDSDEIIIDLFLSLCDPENIFWQIDTRHIVVARKDPLEFARKYKDRAPFIHVHDCAELTGEDSARDCAVGSGIVDNKGAVLASGNHEWLIVEETPCENDEDSLADMRKSLAYLRANF
ncbi:MAG: sugar phosphate isomerase/epimerase [Clostridia bacterium]|nr:sugar phosphate isomerase/epimerase [Clostridia bacterium]